MANNFSDYLETSVLNHFFKAGGSSSVSQPTNLYVALYTTLPGEDGTGGTEVSGGAYARQAITWKAVTTNGTAKRTVNNGAITFPTATASWGTVVGIAVIDSSSGAGNMFVIGNLTDSGGSTTTKTVGIDDSLSFADATITVDLD